MEEKVLSANSVILHIASPNDLPVIFELVDSYCEDMEIDKTVAKNALRDIVYLKSVLLVEYGGNIVGGIAGYVIPGMFTEDMFFSTVFFYIRKEFRFLTKQTVKELELVLLPTAVTKIAFGVLANEDSEKQKRFYRMLGYKELETHLMKRI